MDQHPYLDRIISAEADRLALVYGCSAVERDAEDNEVRVFGLVGDVQMGMVVVNPDGSVVRT
jgi:hypothetical protein